MNVEESIETSAAIPEEYPTWIQTANAKIALNFVPLERKLVQFKAVKGENPYKTAYRAATEDKIETHEEPILVDEEYDDVETVEEVDEATGETVTKTITTKKTRQVKKGTRTVETKKPAPFSGWLDDESGVEE